MIIRIMAEGQYKVSGDTLVALDEADNFLLDAISSGDHQEFERRLREVVELVRSRGERVADTELVESDLILPAPDTTLEEARDLFASYPRDLT